MLNNKAQSVIEYAALAMLVIVATMVMGPYVVRSIGSHFKVWQEQVDDSASDRLLQDPESVVASCEHTPFIAGACKTPWNSTHLKPDGKPNLCSGVLDPTHLTGCQKMERNWHIEGKDNPDCYYCEECRFDATCCLNYRVQTPTPECGKRPLLAHAFGDDRSVYAPRAAVPKSNPPYLNALPINQLENENRSCYYGEELVRNDCYNNWGDNPPPGVAPILCQLQPLCDPKCVAPSGGYDSNADSCHTDPATLTKNETLTFYHDAITYPIVKVEYKVGGRIVAGAPTNTFQNKNNGRLQALFCGCGIPGLPDGAGVVKPSSFSAIATPTLTITKIFADLQSAAYISPDGQGTVMPKFYDQPSALGSMASLSGVYTAANKVAIYNVLNNAETQPGVKANKFCHQTNTINNLDCDMTSDLTLAPWATGAIKNSNPAVAKINATISASPWAIAGSLNGAIYLGRGVEDDKAVVIAGETGWKTYRYKKYDYYQVAVVGTGALVANQSQKPRAAYCAASPENCLLYCPDNRDVVLVAGKVTCQIPPPPTPKRIDCNNVPGTINVKVNSDPRYSPTALTKVACSGPDGKVCSCPSGYSPIGFCTRSSSGSKISICGGFNSNSVALGEGDACNDPNNNNFSIYLYCVERPYYYNSGVRFGDCSYDDDCHNIGDNQKYCGWDMDNQIICR